MPKGIPTDKVAAIQSKIAELQERLKTEKAFGHKRKALLGYCKRRELTRADLYAVVDQMPLERITRKHRLAQAKAKAKKTE